MVERAIADLYGVSGSALRSVTQIQHLSLQRRGASWNGDSSTCARAMRELSGAADPFDAALTSRWLAHSSIPLCTS